MSMAMHGTPFWATALHESVVCLPPQPPPGSTPKAVGVTPESRGVSVPSGRGDGRLLVRKAGAGADGETHLISKAIRFDNATASYTIDRR